MLFGPDFYSAERSHREFMPKFKSFRFGLVTSAPKLVPPVMFLPSFSSCGAGARAALVQFSSLSLPDRDRRRREERFRAGCGTERINHTPPFTMGRTKRIRTRGRECSPFPPLVVSDQGQTAPLRFEQPEPRQSSSPSHCEILLYAVSSQISCSAAADG